MKTLIVFAALVAIALADVSHLVHHTHRNVVVQREAEPVVVVKEFLQDNIGLGGYKYNYHLSDGQTREESAQVEVRGIDQVVPSVSGSFSWVDAATGVTYSIRYVADENGFHPEGDHLPVAPVV